MNEYYGAAASDALTTAETFDSGYWTGYYGYKTPTDPSSGLDVGNGNLGPYTGVTPLQSADHYWPQGADGKPHAFVAEHPSFCDTVNVQRVYNRKFYSSLGSSNASNSTWVLNGAYNDQTLQYYMGTGSQNSPGIYSRQWYSAPLQRLAPGTWRIEGRCRYGPAKTGGRTHQVTVYLMEREGMTLNAAPNLAKVTGGKKETQLFAGPLSETGIGALSTDIEWEATVTTTYEWTYLNTYSQTNTYSGRYDETYIYGIYPA